MMPAAAVRAMGDDDDDDDDAAAGEADHRMRDRGHTIPSFACCNRVSGLVCEWGSRKAAAVHGRTHCEHQIGEQRFHSGFRRSWHVHAP